MIWANAGAGDREAEASAENCVRVEGAGGDREMWSGAGAGDRRAGASPGAGHPEAEQCLRGFPGSADCPAGAACAT
jgi:hypothetical protein